MRRWYFWVLAPVMLTTGIGLPFIVHPPTWQGSLVLYVFSATLIVATLALAAPRRFGWAVKSVAAVVLLAYVAYASTEAIGWLNGKPFGFGSDHAEHNLFNALQGLVEFGLPSVYLLVRGRSGAAIDALLDVEPDAIDDGNEIDLARVDE